MDIDILRHSVSHVMAQAVLELFPGTCLAIGPSTKEGFYYDFDLEHNFTPEDLLAIENKMQEIIDKNYNFEKVILSKNEAIELFKSKGQHYKVEILKEIEDNQVSIYRNGSFEDLCRGPHLESTGLIKAFKLLSVAGAYWRGDEKNKMLQRIYGTAFGTREELDEYLNLIEEAKKRDHRKLGTELDLFSTHDQAGAGLILWHPKGACVRHVIEDFWKKEHIKRGYDLVYIPHISKVDLWKTSGHWEFYRENMYSPMKIDEDEYIVKPMNCPGHILIYKSRLRSYRELPIRYAELGTVYRYERSGVLHGMMRVRGFTQDDAHIFCTPDQLEDEIKSVINLTLFMMETFGFSYLVYLSTRPEKYAGTIENWETATNALKSALDNLNIVYEIDPGEGVFYGPKIDIKLVDAIGRQWQGPTIQVDFNNPMRFDMNYIASDGKEHNVVMVHRAVLGSMERFMGILTEHYAGAFPVWLSPVQVKVISIGEIETNYPQKVYDILKENGIRCEKDFSDEKLGQKIRRAQLDQIPYMLVIGKRESEESLVSVRYRRGKDISSMTIEEFLQKLKIEIAEKSQN